MNQGLFITPMRKQLIMLLCISVGMAVGSFFFEHIIGLHNCHLCIFQRNIAIVLSAILLVFIIHDPADYKRRLYALILMLISVFGVIFAGRHAWIQTFQTEKIANCDPSLSILMERLPISTLIERVFYGNGECSQSLTTFLGLTIPSWSFLLYLFFYLFSLKILIRNK
ncbi:MAG: Disulfide bond formation protein B [uncultured Thiotrichaceae bacterium]|uniref:Disulfide bond formation protein B n=1 Tax=uncultured Thiotrichaceae bacterium TaxID=298394 RepID=A0A6S6UDK9_9GAMM|nr:MAG: Disulfide bond formation protein B [uncultured Thiotrichaceae bacterium]